jgi:hypothetical protein
MMRHAREFHRGEKQFNGVDVYAMRERLIGFCRING